MIIFIQGESESHCLSTLIQKQSLPIRETYIENIKLLQITVAKHTALMLAKVSRRKEYGWKWVETTCATPLFSLILLSHSLAASPVSFHFSFLLCSTSITSASQGIVQSNFLLSQCLPDQATFQRQFRSGQNLHHKTPSIGVELRVRVHLKIHLTSSHYSSVPTAGMLVRKLPQVPHLLNFLSSNTLLPKFLFLLYICESSSYS